MRWHDWMTLGLNEFNQLLTPFWDENGALYTVQYSYERPLFSAVTKALRFHVDSSTFTSLYWLLYVLDSLIESVPKFSVST